MERSLVLIVDDDTVFAQVIAGVLKGRHELEVASNGPEALRMAEELKPDAVLLDIEMPDMDGYEVCHALRSRDETRELPVIMVSSHNDINSRLAAYEVGADDYVSKPIRAEELRYKTAGAVARGHERRRLEAARGEAMNMAMMMMTNMGETGVVMNYLRRCFQIETILELARETLGSIGEFGLKALIQVRDTYETISLSSDGPATDLEESVIERARGMGRIFEFSSRMAVNYEHVTLIGLNVPQDDADRRGRLRDNLAIIAEGMNSRVQTLMLIDKEQRYAERMSKVVERMRESILGLGASYNFQRKRMDDSLAELMDDIDTAGRNLDLNKAQSTALRETVRGRVEQARASFSEGLGLERFMERMLDMLNKP